MSEYASHIPFLKRCVELSVLARESGNTPFGALLVGPTWRSCWSMEMLKLRNRTARGTQKLC